MQTTLNWESYIESHKQRFLDEMMMLLRVPSISTLPDHQKDIKAGAKLCEVLLKQSGCDLAEVIHTSGNPVVYGEKLTDPKKPTVLIYGHYDVQPVDPLDRWKTDPFEPAVMDNKIFARGASDNKGQLFIHFKALEVLTQTKSDHPNLKFLIEGEEEVGSPSLAQFIRDHKKLLHADIVLISDNAMLGMETPSLEISFRGACALEVEVTGPDRDLHSGLYGGTVANPITILSQMISRLFASDNSIAVPGFYDNATDIQPINDQEWEEVSFDEVAFKEALGIRELWGEQGYAPQDRIGKRPAIDVCGIEGGYSGKRIKSIIPHNAYAKISSRIVPNQTSSEISGKIADYIKSISPECVNVDITHFGGSEPYQIDIHSPYFKAAAKAIENVYLKSPVLVRDGASLPICHLIEKELGIKSILLGFGLPNDNLHGPNEKLELSQFYRGLQTVLNFHKNILDEISN